VVEEDDGGAVSDDCSDDILCVQVVSNCLARGSSTQIIFLGWLCFSSDAVLFSCNQVNNSCEAEDEDTT